MAVSVKSVKSNSVGEEVSDSPSTSVEIELNALIFSLNNLEAAFMDLSDTINPFMVSATESFENCIEQDPAMAPVSLSIKHIRNRIEYLRSEINDHISRLVAKF